MKRRRGEAASSLDLLLDTICNTFGGVLFLAILFAVLLRNPSHNPAGVEASDPTEEEYEEASLQMQALENSLNEAQAKLAVLEKAAEAQARLVQRMAIPGSEQALEDFRNAQARNQQLTAERSAQLAQLDRRQAELDQSRADEKALDRQLEEQVEEVRLAEAELNHEKSARTQTTRLPRLRTSRKREAGVVIRYGRMYVWHEYEGDQRAGVNKRDFVVVYEDANYMEVTPKPYAGVPLDDTPASRSAVRQTLGRFNPRDFRITIVAFDDSFDRFQPLKRTLIEMDFEYRLIPKGKKAVFDRGGTGNKVQ